MNATPSWISNHNAAADLREQQRAEEAKRAQERSAILAVKGPQLWNEFVRSIVLNANSVSQLKDVKLHGSGVSFGKPGEEMGCTITITNQEGASVSTPVYSLTFHRADNGIRVTRQNWTDVSIPFSNSVTGVGFLYMGKVCSGTKLGEVIAQHMVAVVTKK